MNNDQKLLDAVLLDFSFNNLIALQQFFLHFCLKENLYEDNKQWLAIWKQSELGDAIDNLCVNKNSIKKETIHHNFLCKRIKNSYAGNKDTICYSFSDDKNSLNFEFVYSASTHNLQGINFYFKKENECLFFKVAFARKFINEFSVNYGKDDLTCNFRYKITPNKCDFEKNVYINNENDPFQNETREIVKKAINQIDNNGIKNTEEATQLYVLLTDNQTIPDFIKNYENSVLRKVSFNTLNTLKNHNYQLKNTNKKEKKQIL